MNAAARALPFVTLVALLGSVSGVLAERAEAEAKQAPLFVRLSPTAESQHLERTTRLEHRLVSALLTWPSIERAEVLLALPLLAGAALDRPLPSARATVLLTHAGRGPTRAEVFALLHASLPTLSAMDLTLIEHEAVPAAAAAHSTEMVSVGPFRVAPDTAAGLRWMLAFSLAIHALFAGIVLWRLRLGRVVVRKVDPRARTPSPP